MMSLVEYGSSDSEEEEEEEEEAPAAQAPSPSAAATPPLPQPNENPVMVSSGTVPAPSPTTAPAPSISTAQTNTVPASSLPSLDELPDAEFLFSSPQNGSRKRESNGHGAVPAQQKFPRGGSQSSVAQVRNSRAPIAGALVPPQLAGRSNVVTEDINKLFVNRRRNSSG